MEKQSILKYSTNQETNVHPFTDTNQQTNCYFRMSTEEKIVLSQIVLFPQVLFTVQIMH
uniref:Uncharacterized protein n=1 Tax=Arion vulgaris TaxID=1028688 RepID=A0A0B6YVW0_9EUPU